jgi:hypothetical protein
MKEKEIYAQRLPAMGDRSKSVFGIRIKMHPSFFADCSSKGYRNRTRQPICKRFAKDYKLQLEQRDKMTEAMTRHDYTKEECLTEWANVCSECTDIATSAFFEKYGPLPECGFLPPSEKADEALDYAAKKARSAMLGIADLRAQGVGITCRPTYDLGLGFSDEVIYCYKQRMHTQATQGTGIYKIGKTRVEEKRSRTYRTHNTDLEHISTISKAGVISEAAIHRLFASCLLPGEREWFRLTPDQAALIQNPSALAVAIRRAGVE